jgi:hypothetical protein
VGTSGPASGAATSRIGPRKSSVLFWLQTQYPPEFGSLDRSHRRIEYGPRNSSPRASPGHQKPRWIRSYSARKHSPYRIGSRAQGGTASAPFKWVARPPHLRSAVPSAAHRYEINSPGRHSHAPVLSSNRRGRPLAFRAHRLGATLPPCNGWCRSRRNSAAESSRCLPER